MIKPLIKHLGKIDYMQCWVQMKAFTEKRDAETQDELWIVEHNPIFTLGLSAREEHILFKNHNIPIVRTDRGGQVTYHGPGQIIIYTLIDIKRLGITIRDLVTRIENAVIKYLAHLEINSFSKRDAPGVYVNQQKIASLGLKIRRGCSYHGISFNYAIDKEPFNYINPCGYAGLEMINLLDLTSKISKDNYSFNQIKLANHLIDCIYPINK